MRAKRRRGEDSQQPDGPRPAQAPRRQARPDLVIGLDSARRKSYRGVLPNRSGWAQSVGLVGEREPQPPEVASRSWR